MPTAWFICPMERVPHPLRVTRRCAMDSFTSAIRADGGSWAETEVLGQRAVVKVNASAATLTTIAGTAGFTRVPSARLDDPLSSLSNGQRNAIRNLILELGYTPAEVAARFPNLSAATVGDVLRFMASRRRKVRHDAATDSIVDDGDVVTPTPVDHVDRMV